MIVRFWQLPENRNYLMLRNGFKNKIVQRLEAKKYSWKIRNKLKKGKISIRKLKKIAKEEKIPLDVFEKNIIWIGGNNSLGLSNPKFPIDFSSRVGARFIASIINDGTLTKEGSSYGRLMYDNFDESLRESVIKDYTEIFGGKKEEVAFRETDKKRYLEFTSVIRDIIEKIIKEKGPKCETNIKLPEFILKNKECMLGWIEQTLADEGEIKFYPEKYRRAIIWRRSLDVTEKMKGKINKDTPFRKLQKEIQEILLKKRFNLIESEKKILESLDIKYIIYNLGIYKTERGKIRTRWQIMITKRENLLKLREIIKIPSKEKDKKFNRIVKGFTRFLEPLNVKNKIIEIGKNKKNFTSFDLKKKMLYKQTQTAIKWLRIFEKEKLIIKVEESKYGGGRYRRPAKYTLHQISKAVPEI